MKNTYLSPANIFLNCLIIFSLLICFNACSPKKPKPVFDINTPGSEVVASFNDTLPQIVVFYKVDENGNKTHEIIGEAYYYENKQERKVAVSKMGKETANGMLSLRTALCKQMLFTLKERNTDPTMCIVKMANHTLKDILTMVFATVPGIFTTKPENKPKKLWQIKTQWLASTAKNA